MIHNWAEMIHKTITNAQGKKLDGADGDWDSALYQLIHESCKQPLDEQDEAVVCVLIALYESLRSVEDLKALADLCVSFSRKREAK